MTYQDILDLVRQGESETLEFKKSTAQLKNAAESLCGFLNHNGGLVLIGVLNDGTILGQQVADPTQQEIANTLEKFEPHADIEVHYVFIPDRHEKVIALYAMPHLKHRPYSFDGRAFYRQQSSTVLMSQSRYQDQFLEYRYKPLEWDRLPCSEYTVEALDTKRILEVFQQGLNKERLPAQPTPPNAYEALRRLRLLTEGQLTNAAIVLFCRDPLPHFPQCLLKLASFRDPTKRDILDSRQVYGNIFDLYEESEHFIRRHTSVTSHFVSGQAQRVDIPDYPPLAVREILINAFCHRDYMVSNSSVMVALYPDHLEIASHGGLVKGLTPELLKIEHDSWPRNGLIADVLYRCGFIETYGTGTQEVIRLCLESSMKEPDFIERGHLLAVKLYKANREVNTVAMEIKTRSLKPVYEQIIAVLQEKSPLNNREIEVFFEGNYASRTIRRYLKDLETRGILVSQGEGKAKRWRIA